LAGIRAGAADLLIDVLHHSRWLGFDLPRITVETKICRTQRHWSEACGLLLRRPVDQNAIPVDLQIGPDAYALSAGWQFVAEVCGHRAWTTCGKTHVVNYAGPLAGRSESFDVRRDRFNTCLIRGIHSCRGEVFDLAIHHEPERATFVRLAKIQF